MTPTLRMTPYPGRPVITARAEDTCLTPLELRALDELALGTRCSLSDRLACCERCWSRWVRARLIEHLRGERYWQELDRGDFGLLRARFHPNGALVAEVVGLVGAGVENLLVIAWALDVGRSLDDVLAILTVLDVNAHRIPRFVWLPSAAPCAGAVSRRGKTHDASRSGARRPR